MNYHEMYIESPDKIRIYGARVHNLKNIDVTIPRGTLTVITGVSGSGKSSLAFDTIYAEGQRRYLETLSSYARQFIGNLEKPDVDKITGLSPVISIEQKTTITNPRSTVGTVTEIYDFLRLLFARASIAYSYITGEKMVKYTDEQITDLIIKNFPTKKIMILAPVVKSRKGHYRELFENYMKKGYLHARIDGEIKELKYGMKLDRYKTHDIEIVVDKLIVNEESKQRIRNSIYTALSIGKGTTIILDIESNTIKYYSKNLMCPTSGISYNDPAPNTFSFNSPQGACSKCNGLGYITNFDLNKIIKDPSLSIKKGLIPSEIKNNVLLIQIEALGKKYNFNLNTPIKDLSEEALQAILYGDEESLSLENLGIFEQYFVNYKGLINYLKYEEEENGSNKFEQYLTTIKCPECQGTRLKKEALYFLINNKNIAQLAEMDLESLYDWFNNLNAFLDEKQKIIANEIIKEIKTRIKFLLDVGLGYLSLNRPTNTLSGGESQRIRLATQIGTQLVNVIYILDEPSIGLHPRDNIRLIEALKKLRDQGNSVIVIEHDREMIESADYIIDLGPGAGKHGGKVVACGTLQEIKQSNSLTAKYLKNEKFIPIPSKRRKGTGKYLILKGAKGNNLKNITLEIPLGKFICVTGVSGSGKSSLIYDTLYPILSKHFYNSKVEPLLYDSIEGLENINKVIEVDQSPIGKTPRSNPATYTGVFNEIRNLFASLPESKVRGYKPGRFSFNVKGGRCEACQGAGVKIIEMNFLPDVYITCDECNGKRYNRETLEIKYKGKSIGDVLEMTIEQAAEFFENIPSISYILQTMKDVGLYYLTLGQPATTLSGGESQRIKLAAELARRDTGKTLYILDEPTTGLHFEDIRLLLNLLHGLVDKGNTVIVIEHNLDVIKTADYIIDMGKEGGDKGGYIIAKGTPEEIAENNNSYTGYFLKKELMMV